VSNADDSLPPSRQTLRSLVDPLDARSFRYAIIGRVATIQHTRVRTTNDIDALLAVPQRHAIQPRVNLPVGDESD
jgi:hypothetical protein